jgi:hypothetical protein
VRWLAAGERAAVRATLDAPEGAADAPVPNGGAVTLRLPADAAASEKGPLVPLAAGRVPGTGDTSGGGCDSALRRAARDLLHAAASPVVVVGSVWSLLFGMSTQAYVYWLPMIIASLLDSGLAGGGPKSSAGHSRAAVLLTTVPFVAAAAAQAGLAWHSQRAGERRWHTAAVFALSGTAAALIPLPMARGAPAAAFALLTVAVAAAFAGTGAGAGRGEGRGAQGPRIMPGSRRVTRRLPKPHTASARTPSLSRNRRPPCSLLPPAFRNRRTGPFLPHPSPPRPSPPLPSPSHHKAPTSVGRTPC